MSSAATKLPFLNFGGLNDIGAPAATAPAAAELVPFVVEHSEHNIPELPHWFTFNVITRENPPSELEYMKLIISAPSTYLNALNSSKQEINEGFLKICFPTSNRVGKDMKNNNDFKEKLNDTYRNITFYELEERYCETILQLSDISDNSNNANSSNSDGNADSLAKFIAAHAYVIFMVTFTTFLKKLLHRVQNEDWRSPLLHKLLEFGKLVDENKELYVLNNESEASKASEASEMFEAISEILCPPTYIYEYDSEYEI